MIGSTINSAVLCIRQIWSITWKWGLTVTTELTVILQNIQYSTHLGEDQNSRSFCLHRFEEFIENDHFTGIINEVLIGREGWSWFLQISFATRCTIQLTAPSKTE